MKHRSNEVMQLSEIEHCLSRKGMYVGATARSGYMRWVIEGERIKQIPVEISPGLLKLFDEIISNSIDEALRTNFEFANKIDCVITGNTIKVSDNGRGIPVVKAKDASVTQAEMAFTSLRAGANFGEESFVSIGTNGLGATLANIMSTVFRAETCDGKKKLSLLCTKNLSTTNATIKRCKTQGTSVEYTPDFSLFEQCTSLNEFDLLMINKRLLDLSICFPEITFTFNGKKVNTGASSMRFRRYVKQYSDDAITAESDNFKIAVFPTSEPTHVSFVNGIDTYEGGTHVTVVYNTIVNQLLDAFKKKYKKLNIKPQDIKNHLGLIVFTNSIKSARFRSQTKEFITNPASEIRPIFEALESNKKFFNSILKSDVLIDPIIETKKLKMEAAERAAIKRAQKSTKKVKVAKHVPANSKDPRKKFLFLSEGDSASGQLLSVRDPVIHGSYPCRGKSLNVTSKKPSVVLANAELSNIMAIIGLSIGKKAEDLNYNNIIIMTDEDFDGHACASLLINFFATYWPELISSGKLKKIQSPIMIASKKKDVKRFYDLESFYKEQNKLKGYDLTYCKGLGSLKIEEYKEMINNPKYINIGLDKDYKNSLNVVFGDNSELRKDWLTQ